MPMEIKLDQSKIKFEAPASALARHNPEIQAASEDAKDGAVSINVYSTIGEYGDGNGMTPKIVSAILKKAEGRDVTVNINSPGGDFFDGVAIYNLLREYKGNVKVRVLGLAASAASVVALAGDSVEIAKAGFFMIHNAWTFAIGNRNDMTEAAAMLAKFDGVMSKIYSDYTGIDEKDIQQMMDSETWIAGEDAVSQNFAHALLGEEAVKSVPQDKTASAMREIDVALAKAGVPRAKRRDLLKELSGTPSAADDATPSAGELKAALMGLLFTTQK